MSIYLSTHECLTYLLYVILINFSHHCPEAADKAPQDSHIVPCTVSAQRPNTSG